ncbi:MAG TPA: sigma 54-interacting transcriptional regulator [Burkholderiales bacterium]|jgi:two-component system response regulator GlrR|nr:sigma 54-interacting transcriptional regulator [Burkholderiales bacterium]
MSKPAVLIVDDDADLLRLISIRLTAAGYQVTEAASAERALALLSVSPFQLVITDLKMSGMDGMALFDAVHQMNPTLPVIILTAHGTIPDAVAATKRGVFGYLTKPFDARELLKEVETASSLAGWLPKREEDRGWREDIITRSPIMEGVLAKAKLVAESDASVCIFGESGSGKEMLARAIHKASPRRAKPFVAVNCGAIPEPLLESELFGHAKGAFTGAIRDHGGLFQSAAGGTILLDEIGDMPLSLQVKLLRVIQEMQVRPVGSTQSIPVNSRMISATHRDLAAEIVSGKFREDLYYRLNVVSLTVPSLAERREDIPLLAAHFLSQLAEKYGRRINGFAPEAMELLVASSWPGNVRQLFNVVEQTVALCTTSIIPSSLLKNAIHRQASEFTSLEQARKRFEREYLSQILKITDGNVSAAARLAKRNRTEFYKLLQRHELDPSLFKPQKSN